MFPLKTLLSSHRRYLRAKCAAELGDLATFLAAYSKYEDCSLNYFRKEYDRELKKLCSDETLLMGGDALHLSNSMREEQVSAWLKWVLEAPILPLPERKKILENIFNAVITSPEYSRHSGSTGAISFDETPEFLAEVVLPSRQRLDIVINTGDLCLVIENKLWDRSLEKNSKYLNEIRMKWPRKRVVPILLLPGANYGTFPDSEREELFSPFPPVFWESLAAILRRETKSVVSPAKERTYWTVITNTFISFVEANVLEFGLKEIRDALRNRKPGEIKLTPAITDYIRYRREYGGV